MPGRYNRRPFVVRVERVHLADRAFRPSLPGPLERRTIHRGIEGLKELPVRPDGLGDEIASGRGEHRPALVVVGVEQVLTGPSLEHRCQLPSQVARVLEAGIHAVPAVRRVAVCGIPGDEDMSAPDKRRRSRNAGPRSRCARTRRRTPPLRLREDTRGSRSCPAVVPGGTGAWKNHVLPRSTRPKNFQ